MKPTTVLFDEVAAARGYGLIHLVAAADDPAMRLASHPRGALDAINERFVACLSGGRS